MRRIMVLLAAFLVLLTAQCGCCTSLVNELVGRLLPPPSITYPPGAEVIVPESEKPFVLLLSPNREEMLYEGRNGWVILNLETGERIELGPLGDELGWINDDYIIARKKEGWSKDEYCYIYKPRLVINAGTGEIRSIEEFGEEEIARLARDSPRDSRHGRYYSPHGQYYYEAFGDSQGNDHIVIYSQGGEKLNEYAEEQFLYVAWAHDSSGVYILVYVGGSGLACISTGPPKSAILKLPVSPPPSGPAIWLRALVIVVVALALVVFTLLGWLTVKRRRRPRRSG